MSKILLLLALLPLAAHADHGGDGGVFNGPSMSPGSIPVATDQGLSLVELNNAFRFCGITGDADKGIRSAIVRLLQDIHGGTLADWKAQLIPSSSTPVGETPEFKRLHADFNVPFRLADGTYG